MNTDAKTEMTPELEAKLKVALRKYETAFKAAGSPPECSTCKTTFTSWKARRAHLRGTCP